MPRKQTLNIVATSAAHEGTPETTLSGTGNTGDVAHRAYELYLERGREDGHDIDDWLQAERELQHPVPVESMVESH
jgi:hypothetical protein